ncbi:hypothetical protein Phum_PHUM169910 [Pediculus humanus corporis]|uniref:Uncharacterized protein n=1 Tax=Pediculus humanus subsp. corporis TaxID=121224 RepID=E0VFY6_PEDHC|nr:uncharacterized protein Phum_PHUM169910 [Pediculus humanus corporis]EEB12292.1 hypothetical protein Phum_PHUM169910 [Pediculus humanus corporis]
MNQTSFVSIEEDGSICLKNLVGYASPKLTPKHSRSVKQSKRRTKSHESPHLEFPPPPSFPPPEHYDLSDEYSVDLIDNNLSNCNKNHNRLINDNLISFRTTDRDDEGFWNSPVEAPWSYFLGGVSKDNYKEENGKWIYDGRRGGKKKENNLNETNQFWEDRTRTGVQEEAEEEEGEGEEEESWICKNFDSSTPYMERKSKMKKKNKKNKPTDETDHVVSEEIMLINKLKEDFINGEDKNLNDVKNYRSEIWVSAVPVNESEREDLIMKDEKNQDGSCIQMNKNHISNVLITHGNDEILDNFIENKPIHKGNQNFSKNDKYEVNLIHEYTGSDDMDDDRSDDKNIEKRFHRRNENCKRDQEKDCKISVVSNDVNDRDYRFYKNRKNATFQGPIPENVSVSGDSPDEYSYAYYEAGPVNRIITSTDPNRYGHDRNSRYTYTTRYGTEENIYEEITEVGYNLKDNYFDGQSRKKFNRQPRHYHQGSLDSGRKREENYVGNHPCSKSQSQMSLNQSILEEEVREVQSTHRRVLGQLNLTMEEMLMPNVLKEKDGGGLKEDGDFKKVDVMMMEDNQVNHVTDLDSGFSGSSGTSVSFYGIANGCSRSGTSVKQHDAPRYSLANNSKIYPQIFIKSKTCNETAPYVRSGPGCCGDHCYVEKYSNQRNEKMNLDYPSNNSIDVSYRKNSHSSVKSLSFPRGMTPPVNSNNSFSKRLTGSGSWAKRGWKKLTGLSIGSTNKNSEYFFSGCCCCCCCSESQRGLIVYEID